MRRGPHWLLNDPDAKAYGFALANALRHLPVTMAQKYVDFTALGVAVIAYEGPRIAVDVALRGQREAPRPAPSRPAQVFRFRAGGSGPTGGPERAGAPDRPGEAMPLGTGPSGDMTYEPQDEDA